jgi:hypothetical protein
MFKQTKDSSNSFSKKQAKIQASVDPKSLKTEMFFHSKAKLECVGLAKISRKKFRFKSRSVYNDWGKDLSQAGGYRIDKFDFIYLILYVLIISLNETDLHLYPPDFGRPYSHLHCPLRVQKSAAKGMEKGSRKLF